MRLAFYSQSHMALGGDVTLSLVSDKPSDDISKIFDELWRYVYTFERSFSRFIPMSELSIFNRSAGVKTTISAEFRNLLLAAKDMSFKTKGIYNPFILPALQKSGYKGSAVVGYEEDPVDDFSRRHVGTVEQLEIGDDWAVIPFDTALDMGGCGKGYLADLLGTLIMSKGISNYRLSLGGDIATCGTDELGNRWLIGIQDATNLSGELAQMIKCPVRPFAIATSGTFRRAVQSTDKNWHHIIDPLTLEPALTDVRLVTVCADSALLADVLASCAVIVGSKKAATFTKALGATKMVLQGENQHGLVEEHFGTFVANDRVKEGAH